jgi:hypothetical protein
MEVFDNKAILVDAQTGVLTGDMVIEQAEIRSGGPADDHV